MIRHDSDQRIIVADVLRGETLHVGPMRMVLVHHSQRAFVVSAVLSSLSAPTLARMKPRWEPGGKRKRDMSIIFHEGRLYESPAQEDGGGAEKGEVMGDITKLPLWAQDKIKQLNNEILNLKSKLAQHELSQEPTRIMWGSRMYGTFQYIKDYETVTFNPFNADNQEICIHLTEDNAVNVHCTLGQLVVLPHSGNWIKIYTDRTYREVE